MSLYDDSDTPVLKESQQMAIKDGRLRFSRFRMHSYLLGVVLLITAVPLQAEDARTYIWIQDPYTGESILTSHGEPDYEESLKADLGPPLGILTIRKLNINVPIFNGTDDVVLDRGAGRIKGMAKMDEIGNLGISSHRDGYFRRMKDMEVGDDILIQTTRGVQKYEVSSISIVPKSDISPLASSTEKMLTIVTCYPFYFVGNAPKRYIVKATAVDPSLE
jgi:LPXTG-site transpeptidase (sortase) family protein